MLPLALAPMLGWSRPTATLAAIAGESLALIELRGAYSLRLMLLSTMALLLGAAATLGAASAGSVIAAVAVMGMIAALAGVWRHLNSDFGLSLGISSCVLFLIALAYPAGTLPAALAGRSALIGASFGVAVQVSMWPLRSQQPLRRLVAESWLAVVALVTALASSLSLREPDEPRALAEAESSLRATLDKTAATLAAARRGRTRPILTQLEALNLTAARLATRAVALRGAIEPMKETPAFTHFATSLSAVLETLERLSFAVARAVVTRHPGHLMVANLRVERAVHLLDALEARLEAQATDANGRESALRILGQLRGVLPDVRESLRATVDRAGERGFFPLELPHIAAPSLTPVAAALNLRGHVDPALVRYSARIAVLMMLGVGLYRGFDIPRGYWIPLTIIVVLQPDYAATRKKAGLRLLGTSAGVLLASGLLLLNPERGVMLATIAVTMACFAFWVRRNYAVGVFFVTLMLGLLLHLEGTPTTIFVLERLGSTAAGGAIALLAALFFWPSWERHRARAVLASALRANREYLERVVGCLARGQTYDPHAVDAKRAAERAASQVFASLERMVGDPQNQQARIEQIAGLANGNQRLTRILTTVAIGLLAGPADPDPVLEELASAAGEVLGALAEGVERDGADSPELEAALRRLGALRWPPEPGPRLAAARAQLLRANTELLAMGAAARRGPA
jgi:hypothetical protein